jgi:hypothetical protein
VAVLTLDADSASTASDFGERALTTRAWPRRVLGTSVDGTFGAPVPSLFSGTQAENGKLSKGFRMGALTGPSKRSCRIADVHETRRKSVCGFGRTLEVFV